MVALCFAEGTHITTDAGERRIEAVTPGDRVWTSKDEYKTVKWVGVRHMRFAELSEEDARRQRPVLFRQGCLAENLPCRDLVVSGPHGIAINDRLIPASRLVNGVSIVRLDVEEVTYYHIELETHEAIFAEGVSAETYVDIGNRVDFDNSATQGEGAATGPGTFVRLCYQPLYGGPEFDLIRQAIADRARKAFGARAA